MGKITGVCAGLATLIFFLNCNRVSLASAKPVEQDLPTILKSASKNKESMTDAAYKAWLKDNLLGRRIELPFTKALPIEVNTCEVSICDAKYRVDIELLRRGSSALAIEMWTNDSAALRLSKSERLSINGVIKDLVMGTFLTDSVILKLIPVEFQVLKD